METRLFLSGLRLPVRIGWTPEERSRPQTVVLEVEIGFRYEEDRGLAGTVDYGGLVEALGDLRGREFALLEEMAAAAADLVIGFSPRVMRVRVRAGKVDPPLPLPLRMASVEVERVRDA
ncbi:MAG TPA: hypothetical protein ENF77_04955 [Candidatus Acetothermia bacterium]|nr:dihydroneopterin aldolase [Candidatus Bipolaricaulota bacterium]HDI11645.1 hypothetical protein [Candidatus Acetothermia bacterium]